MKNYSIDKNALGVPFIESPFFNKILENSNYSEEEKNKSYKTLFIYISQSKNKS